MSAAVAVGPGEAFVQIAAVEKALQALVVDAAVDVAALAQLFGMLPIAAVQRTGPRVAGAIGRTGRCRFRSRKIGLGLAAKTGLATASAESNADPDTLPFQLQHDPCAAAVGFLQYHAYMILMVDRHILRVLDSLESSGLRDDTIVVFVSDTASTGRPTR